jgi:hypothetical protein
MSPAEVDWGPAVAVVLAGLVLGALVVVWVRRRAATAGVAASSSLPLELRDLEGRIDALLQQLRELEDTAAKRTPEQLARERYSLELAAARALQERQALLPALPKTRGTKKGRRRVSAEKPAAAQAATPVAAVYGLASRPGLRGFLWGVGSVAVLALMVFLALRAAQPRAQGGSLTGDTAPPGETATAADGEPQIRAAIARNPDDHEARLDLARHLLGKRDLKAVWDETQHVLARSPGHPRALAYQALVRLAMGQADLAESMLKQAVAGAPDLLEAHLHVAYV